MAAPTVGQLWPRSGLRTSATSTVAGTIGYIGIHIATPDSTDLSNNPELSPYGGKTQLQILNAIEAEMRTLTGFTDNPLMSIGHAFMAGSDYLLSSWGTTQVNRMPALIASYKPAGGPTLAGLQATARGDDDALILAMIASLPTGKRIYLCIFHEPSETGGSYATAWRQASARWAWLIINNRGAKDLVPTVILTTFSFRSANASTQAQFLSVTDDYTALGVDWRTQVVMAPDGYQDKAAAVSGDAGQTFVNVFPTLQSLGWRRFGISEAAACSKAGTAGGATITSSDVTYAPIWARSLISYAVTLGAEYVSWFNATGSKDPVGSWMYTDDLKTAWGQAAHNHT